MITLNNATVYFGGQTLFEKVSFRINSKDRIGLVGRNGTGKTTLLNMINGEEKPNDGRVSVSKGVQIGYLKQDIKIKDRMSVLKETETAFKKAIEVKAELEKLKAQLEDMHHGRGEDSTSIIEKIDALEQQFQILGGYSMQSEISKVLLGLGFQQSDFERPTATFSGGWRMRIELAKLLLKKPDILLLDEPTNHLDIESIIWLEQWLRVYNGAIVLVSHDRDFLNVVTNHTIEIALGNVIDYKAPYSQYVKMREERVKNQKEAKKNQDKFIKHTEQLIEKFRYKKNKATFAQTLIKKLDMLDRIEVETTDLSGMHFRFPPPPHSGKVVVKATKVCKSYDSLQVLDDVSLEIGKGEKIAFVGKNGEGKTTLARIIVDDLPFEGDMNLGHLVQEGYYAQNQSDLLNEDITVIKTIEDSATDTSSTNVRNILGSFLFSGDTVDKKVSVLSGGEKARLALCKLLLKPVNLLVMDEPTNHLDMLSKDILKRALMKYTGTLIIVSHDREFLRGLTSKVYEFKDHNIKEYIGDVAAFLKARNMADFKELSATTRQQNKEVKQPSSQKQDYEAQKQLKRDIRNSKNRLSKLEKEIGSQEEEIKEMEILLADPEKISALENKEQYFKDYETKQQKLMVLMKEWEELQVLLEGLGEN